MGSHYKFVCIVLAIALILIGRYRHLSASGEGEDPPRPQQPLMHSLPPPAEASDTATQRPPATRRRSFALSAGTAPPAAALAAIGPPSPQLFHEPLARSLFASDVFALPHERSPDDMVSREKSLARRYDALGSAPSSATGSHSSDLFAGSKGSSTVAGSPHDSLTEHSSSGDSHDEFHGTGASTPRTGGGQKRLSETSTVTLTQQGSDSSPGNSGSGHSTGAAPDEDPDLRPASPLEEPLGDDELDEEEEDDNPIGTSGDEEGGMYSPDKIQRLREFLVGTKGEKALKYSDQKVIKKYQKYKEETKKGVKAQMKALQKEQAKIKGHKTEPNSDHEGEITRARSSGDEARRTLRDHVGNFLKARRRSASSTSDVSSTSSGSTQSGSSQGSRGGWSRWFGGQPRKTPSAHTSSNETVNTLLYSEENSDSPQGSVATMVGSAQSTPSRFTRVNSDPPSGEAFLKSQQHGAASRRRSKTDTLPVKIPNPVLQTYAQDTIDAALNSETIHRRVHSTHAGIAPLPPRSVSPPQLLETAGKGPSDKTTPAAETGERSSSTLPPSQVGSVETHI